MSTKTYQRYSPDTPLGCWLRESPWWKSPKTCAFVPRTSDGRADAPSSNLHARQPLPQRPKEVWAEDITLIPTRHGWLYLAVVMDLCSGRIVGWALASRRGTRGAIFHSDRGSQYGSRAFRALLRAAGLRQSMSARANPYHNAWSESVIGRLKTELLQGGGFNSAGDARTELFAYIEGYYNSAGDARTELFAYIEGYYNTHRLHSSLRYLSPAAFEASLTNQN